MKHSYGRDASSGDKTIRSHELLTVVIRTVFHCLKGSWIYMHTRFVYRERK